MFPSILFQFYLNPSLSMDEWMDGWMNEWMDGVIVVRLEEDRRNCPSES